MNTAGGSWWTRVWRTRDSKRDMVCTFCERPPSELAKLMAGPNVYICDECVDDADRALHGKPADRLTAAKAGSKPRCTFCSKPRDATRAVAICRSANICVECLTVCRQILDDRAG